MEDIEKLEDVLNRAKSCYDIYSKSKEEFDVSTDVSEKPEKQKDLDHFKERLLAIMDEIIFTSNGENKDVNDLYYAWCKHVEIKIDSIKKKNTEEIAKQPKAKDTHLSVESIKYYFGGLTRNFFGDEICRGGAAGTVSGYCGSVFAL